MKLMQYVSLGNDFKLSSTGLLKKKKKGKKKIPGNEQWNETDLEVGPWFLFLWPTCDRDAWCLARYLEGRQQRMNQKGKAIRY